MQQQPTVELRVSREASHAFEAIVGPVLGAHMHRRDTSPDHPGVYLYHLAMPDTPPGAHHIDLTLSAHTTAPHGQRGVTVEAVRWYTEQGTLLATTPPHSATTTGDSSGTT